MRKVVTVIALNVAMLASAAAQAPPTVFQGTLFITSATGADCADSGIAEGNHYVFVYRPFLGSGDTPSGFAYFGPRVAGRISVSGTNDFDASGNYGGVQINARVGFKSYTGSYSGFSVKPANIAGNTRVVEVKGRINGFEEVACNIVFTASGLRRP